MPEQEIRPIVIYDSVNDQIIEITPLVLALSKEEIERWNRLAGNPEIPS